ncbi:glycosyltransferase family 2 protein [Flavobacterium maritimum]|uniref:glycosyltransferase family 2 protein n=1 Tax=Flavobacterium maritimum TaxID=3149042 RepID=UPI0032B353A4
METKPTVSVCMITYAHENFIREAIAGVLIQECDFEVELILVNDCSPDQTDTVVQGIMQNHPRASWINYVKHTTNLGMMPNFIFALQQCKGKYIALCEGDDYWTDPLKLQKQVCFLEANSDYVLCFHKVAILKTNGDLVDDFITKVPENYEKLETLARLGNYIHTPSVVFRNIIKKFPFEFSLTPIGDYFLYLLLAEHGKLKFIDEKMAVYRYGVGVHSTNTVIKMRKSNFKLFTLLLSATNDETLKKIFLERQLNSLDAFEKVIRKEYAEYFVSNHLFFRTLKYLKQPKQLLWKIKKKVLKKS